MIFKSKNLSYMFNKEYYYKVTNPDGSAKNKDDVKNVNLDFISLGVTLEEKNLGKHSISLQVQYPGLLIGIGNSHSGATIAGENIKGEIGLGFTFDYVTGIPYISASTVKGVLRSAFSLGNGEYIRTCLDNKEIDVKALEKEIFEGIKGEEKLHPYETDTFFDAFPSPKTPKEETDELFYLMELDSISPHGNDPFVEPNTLSLVKIKPGVVFDFAFTLYDGLVSAQKKLALFTQILLDFGIGAKTNVGYGLLREVNPDFKITSYKKLENIQNNQDGLHKAEGLLCTNPKCRKFNYKYMKNSNKVYPNWMTKTCCKCGGALK